MLNKDQSYNSEQEEDLDSTEENNIFPIKFTAHCKATEVLSTTKSLTRNTDKYTNFITKYKVQNNPNLLSNATEILTLPGLNNNQQSNLESTQKSQFLSKQLNTEFTNTQYFKLSTAANTLWFPNTTDKNKKLNRSLSKFNNMLGFAQIKRNSNALSQSSQNNNFLPKLDFKAFEKTESKISFTNILPELNVVFDFINNPRYELLRYDVRKIFYNDKAYFEMLRERIEEMKTSSKFEIEEKGFLVKKFYEKNKKYSMLLNSIIIEFHFPTEAFRDPILHYLPLCLLPLFYFNDPQDIKYLFMALVQFTDEFEEISLDFQKMYNFVIFSDKYDTSKSDNIEFSKEKFGVNVFNFKWFTPKYEFDVKIRLPEIKLITDTNKKYCRFADPSFMLHLIANNYVNWDFYCLNFLISDVDFRKTLNLLSSKEHQLKMVQNSFFLSEVDMTKPIFSKEENYSFSLKESKLSVFFTNENNQNFLNTLLPYKTLVNHIKIKMDQPFIFDFNFQQMVALIKIYLKWNLTKFFKKIMNINYKKKTITMDKSYLEKIDDAFLNFTIPYEEFVDIAHQHIDLVIQKPRILLETISGTEYIKYDYDLDDKMLRTLINTEPDDWIKVLNSHKYFMRGKKKKNVKLAVSVKKVGNLAGMFANRKKQEERPLTGKERVVESSMQKEVNDELTEAVKRKSKRRGSSTNIGVNFEEITKKMSSNVI